jgi:hypothetical protein
MLKRKRKPTLKLKKKNAMPPQEQLACALPPLPLRRPLRPQKQ